MAEVVKKLIFGDCLSELGKIEPKSIKALITDPPYMIGAASVGKANAKSGLWVDMENSSYWYAEWLKRARETLTDDGYACVFCNWRSLPTLMCAFSSLAWGIDSLMVWDKDWIGPASKKQLRPTYELVIFASMPASKIENRSASDVFKCKWMAAHSGVSGHPAEKPIDVLRHIINLVSNEGDIILDCFAGSGTTAIAASMEGRGFICIEKDKQCFSEILVNRLNKAGIEA